MDRRQFLATGSAAAVTAALAPATAWAAGGGDAALNADFARIFDAQVARSPETGLVAGAGQGAARCIEGQAVAAHPRQTRRRCRVDQGRARFARRL